MYKFARAITFDGTSLSAFTRNQTLRLRFHMPKLSLSRVPAWLAAIAALGSLAGHRRQQMWEALAAHRPAALLEVQDLETAYGTSQVLFGLGFSIAAGEVATLLGNTPAVCRKAYIDPSVFDGWRDGTLAKLAELATVVEIDMAPLQEAALLLYNGPWVAERTAAIARLLTSAVSMLGKKSGEPFQLSMRKTRVLPGKSSSCWAVNTRKPRLWLPAMARRVPSGSVKEISLRRP